LFGVVDLGVRYVDNDTFGSNESSTQLASNGMADLPPSAVPGIGKNSGLKVT
jgi:hypothetical protein